MFSSVRRFLPGRLGKVAPVVPVVRISGAIGIDAPLRPGVTLASTAPALERAFAMKNAPCVAIVINSPGGSPVQSHLIHRRIRALAEEKGRTVLAFVEDVAASGGYMIAVAADEIIADAASIVGSIGVVSQGFGFVGLLEKLGVERRVHTAGTRKAILDPFRPENPADIHHLEALQAEIHAGFEALVRARRPNLATDEPDLFSGLFWTGAGGEKLGLVDRLGDLRAELRRRYGDDVEPVLVGGARRWPWRRAAGGLAAGAAGAAATQALISAAEERALWARFGLQDENPDRLRQGRAGHRRKEREMPQLFILAAVAATVVGWKLVRREMTRVEERVAAARRSTQAESRVHAGITLVRDPVTGVFRPQQ